MICYEYINNYIRATIKKNEGILCELEDYAYKNHIPIIHPEVASLIKVLVNINKPMRILEIGTAIGYSAILMAQLIPLNGIIDSIERYDVVANKAKENIKLAKLEHKINVIQGDALEVLAMLDKEYDLIFIDAAKGQYLQFYVEAMRMLKVGGLLISDNILYKGMVASEDLVERRKKTIVKRLKDFLDQICKDIRLESSIIPIGDGVALSYRIRK